MVVPSNTIKLVICLLFLAFCAFIPGIVLLFMDSSFTALTGGGLVLTILSIILLTTGLLTLRDGKPEPQTPEVIEMARYPPQQPSLQSPAPPGFWSAPVNEEPPAGASRAQNVRVQSWYDNGQVDVHVYEPPAYGPHLSHYAHPTHRSANDTPPPPPAYASLAVSGHIRASGLQPHYIQRQNPNRSQVPS